MKITREQKFKLEEKLNSGWFGFSRELFGNDARAEDIYDFEMSNYIYFLGNIQSLADLIEGLNFLSPLADDALTIARNMNQKHFDEFKNALTYERQHQWRDSKMPKKYCPLVIPQRFIPAVIVANKLQVPLGTTLIRMMELEIGAYTQ